MNNEIYKEINNFSNYEISNYGNIKNKINQKILKPCIKSGYFCLSLTNNNGERKTVKIHRLVALSFILNPENKDHNKLNNNVNNLEWAPQQNKIDTNENVKKKYKN